MERKFHRSESSLYGLFAPGNESAEERKGLESPQEVVQLGTVEAFRHYSLHLLCREPLFLICFYLHLLFDYTVGCQHLVEWRSGHPVHCVCVPPTGA